MLMIIADRFCFTFIETLKKTNADDNCRFSFTFIKSFLVTQTHIGVPLSNWIPGYSFWQSLRRQKYMNFFFGGDGERSADQVIPDLAALREPERTKPQVCGQAREMLHFPAGQGHPSRQLYGIVALDDLGHLCTAPALEWVKCQLSRGLFITL